MGAISSAATALLVTAGAFGLLGAVAAHADPLTGATTYASAWVPGEDINNQPSTTGTTSATLTEGGPQTASQVETYYLGQCPADDPGCDTSLTQVLNWSASYAAEAQATATPGALHATASASASTSPLSQTVVYVNNQGNTLSNTYVSPLGVTGHAYATANYVDEMTVTSATLPAGSRVGVQFILSLDATGSATYGDVGYPVEVEAWFNFAQTPNACDCFYDDYTYDYQLELGSIKPGTFDQTVATAPLGEQNQTILLTVGDSYLIGEGLEVDAYAQCGSGLCSAAESSENAQDTAGLFIATDPAVTLDFLSGHDYSPQASSPSPVPEPGTLLLLAMGLVSLGLARRRTARAP